MNYSKQLNGLRFFAVMLVLLFHFAHSIGSKISAGYFGVNLFFVISGFLITTILLNTTDTFWKAYSNFLGRRFLRIVPVFYLTVVILFLLGNEYVGKHLFACLTFTFNYEMVKNNLPNNSITHFWSLCIEMQFYLLWPILIINLKKKTSWLKWIILSLVLFSYSQFYFKIVPSWSAYTWVGIVSQFHALGIGAMGALFIYDNSIPQEFFKNKWIEYLVLLLLLFFLLTNYSLKFIFCPILELFLVIKCYRFEFCNRMLSFLLNQKQVIYFGTISYGIYLFHLPAAYYLTKYVFNSWVNENYNSIVFRQHTTYNDLFIKFPLFTFSTILIAITSYEYFEKPLLALKDKYFPMIKSIG